jgi:hypothetical protein
METVNPRDEFETIWSEDVTGPIHAAGVPIYSRTEQLLNIITAE